MKKIIIFDENDERFLQIQSQIAPEHRNAILFKKNWNEYFQFSIETSSVEIKKEINLKDYASFFIHQSHNDPEFPESAIAEIKSKTKGLLTVYVFSGQKLTSKRDQTISRNDFNLYIGDFIQCYLLSGLLCFETFLGRSAASIESLIKEVQIEVEENCYNISFLKSSCAFTTLMHYKKLVKDDEIDFYSNKDIDVFYKFLNNL